MTQTVRPDNVRVEAQVIERETQQISNE